MSPEALPCPAAVLPEQWRRFCARVLVNPATGCWEWIASRQSEGYPTMHLMGHSRETPGREVLVTRWILSVLARPFQPKELACHGCDNHRCVRVGLDEQDRLHLEHGDHSHNLRDAWHRRRRSRPQTFMELP